MFVQASLPNHFQAIRRAVLERHLLGTLLERPAETSGEFVMFHVLSRPFFRSGLLQGHANPQEDLVPWLRWS